MTTGTLLEEVFGMHEWVQNLYEFNVRFVEQLASLLATSQGRRAIASLEAAPPSVKELQHSVEATMQQQHRLSFSTLRGASPLTGMRILATQKHRFGYTLPKALQIASFGDVLPASANPYTIASSANQTLPIGQDVNVVATGDKWARLATPPSIPKDVNLSEIVTSVRNQYYRGTCMAFTCTALLESKILRETHQSYDLSEQYVYYVARLNDPDRSQDGTYFPYTLDGLRDRGACEEMLWPYEAYNDWGQTLTFQMQSPSLNKLDADAARFRISGYDSITPDSVQIIKQKLNRQQLVGIGVPVFKDAWDNNGFVEATGEVQLPLVRPLSDGSEELLDEVTGGHAVALVGYVDTPDPNDRVNFRPGGGYFLFKNSWGTGWAFQSVYQAGYGILPYAYVQKYNQDAYVLA